MKTLYTTLLAGLMLIVTPSAFAKPGDGDTALLISSVFVGLAIVYLENCDTFIFIDRDDCYDQAESLLALGLVSLGTGAILNISFTGGPNTISGSALQHPSFTWRPVVRYDYTDDFRFKPEKKLQYGIELKLRF